MLSCCNCVQEPRSLHAPCVFVFGAKHVFGAADCTRAGMCVQVQKVLDRTWSKGRGG